MSDSHQRKLAAILAADISGYSALMGSDEDATVRDLKGHQAVVLPMIGTHGGRVIDTAGDGILAEFASVLNAVKCAIAVQKVMAERNAAIAPARRMQFRIGVNLGDLIFDDARIYGDGINIAARLESIAEPGGICISDKVQQEIRGKIDVAVFDLGMQTLKNIAEPVRVYRIAFDTGPEHSTVRRKPLEPPGQALPDKPSIAVLPFTDMSGDPDQEFFADGIAEDVVTELSKYRWLSVTARNSSFSYRGRSIDVRQVSRELGVRYVLEGSVRTSGHRVRVTGQLIDATTGSHIWAERYDRDLAELFAVQDEITRAVTAAIGPALVAAEQQRALRKPPESLDAWEAYQRGLWHMARHDVAAITMAREFFQRAIDTDDSFAAPYAALAWAWILGANTFGILTIDEANKKAEPLVRRAISLDPENPDFIARLGLVFHQRGDFVGAVSQTQKALDLAPNCGEALGTLGRTLVFSGQPSKGREFLKRFLQLDPRSPLVPARLAQIVASYYFECDYRAAADAAQDVVRQFPDNPQAHRWLVASLGQLGCKDEVKNALRAMLDVNTQTHDPALLRRDRLWRPEDHEHMLDGLRKAGWTGALD